MTNKEELELWTKKMLQKGLTPMCLVCMDDNGFPHVFSSFRGEMLKDIYRHLAGESSGIETASLEGQEN